MPAPTTPSPPSPAPCADAHALAHFHRTLAELVKADLPLGRALTALAGELERGPLAAAAAAMAAEVEAGAPLGETYAKHGASFPLAYRALVEAGLEAGDLGAVLGDIAEHAARSARFGAEVRRALAFPLVTGVVVVVIAVLLGAFLWLPSMLGAPGTAGDVVRQSVGELGGAFAPTNVTWIGLGLVVLAALLLAGGLWLFAALRRPLDGARAPFGLGLRLPVIGPLLAYAQLGRIAGTLALGLRRGLTLPRVLALGAAVTERPDLRARLLEAERAAVEGAGLADAVEASGIFPTSLNWLVRAAAARGEAAGGLAELARIYEDRLARQATRTAVLATPVAEAVLGTLVLAFALVSLADIFALTSLLQVQLQPL